MAWLIQWYLFFFFFENIGGFWWPLLLITHYNAFSMVTSYYRCTLYHFSHQAYTIGDYSLSISPHRWRWPFNRIHTRFSHVLDSLNILFAFLVTIPETPAGPSFSPLPPYYASSALCLFFFAASDPCALWDQRVDDGRFSNKRKRTTGIRSLDSWSGNLLCWPLDHATPPNFSDIFDFFY